MFTISDIITLYHGSTKVIENPEFGRGNPHNDYGLGFYCTENLELAKEWACASRSGGFANAYSLDMSRMSTLNLFPPEYGLLEWLAILVNHRVFNIVSQIAIVARDYLTEYFLPDISSYDTIKGLRADDSYFTFAMDFLSNTISLRQFGRAMALGSLGTQHMLRSRVAFELLQYIGSEPADGATYFNKRLKRDQDAREQYLKHERIATFRNDDVFMLDVLREELKRDDPRIQRVLSI